MVLVEHDVGFVMEHCDRILALNLGSVLGIGTPDEIRGNAALYKTHIWARQCRTEIMGGTE